MSHVQNPLDITPTLLLRAYAGGVFPMSDGGDSDEIYWVDPKTRGIFDLPRFHVSRSMARFARNTELVIKVNSDFRGTVKGCADRPETWINSEIFELYGTLHRLGYAHSVEVWDRAELVGGVYGVALGGAFFGESMFSRRANASKLALIWLVARLLSGGYRLFDAQFITPHLATLGAVEVSRDDYREKLDAALPVSANFFAMDPKTTPDQVLQRITQTS